MMLRPCRSFLLEPHEEVGHGFFTRQGGVSAGLYASLNAGPGSRDDPENVRENRRRITERLHPGGTLLSLSQTHSATVITVTEPWNEARPEADGMVTNVPGLILGILTADCAPVLFFDPISRVIGAAHAGWKGAFGGVLENTVEGMEALGANRSTLIATIGPCIQQASYEVDAAFYQRFVEEDEENARFFIISTKRPHPNPLPRGGGISGKTPLSSPLTIGKEEALVSRERSALAPLSLRERVRVRALTPDSRLPTLDSKYLFNLPAYVASRLADAGITRIDTLPHDTYANETEFFSFRRTTHKDEPDYGRQLSGIVLR